MFEPEMYEYVYSGIIKNIRSEMEKRDLSVANLAELACLDCNSIYKVLNGKNPIGMKTLINIAYALGLTPPELFPPDYYNKKSVADRFNDLTKDCDLESINNILGIVNDYVKAARHVKEMKMK